MEKNDNKRRSLASGPQRLSVTKVQERKSGSKDANDSGDSEFWGEAAYARAITPTCNLRHSSGVATEDEKDLERREIDLNRRLSKFSEKRNERIKANKGFFLRDKENENLNEEDEENVAQKTSTVDKKRFDEKFREALDQYMNPDIHEKPNARPSESKGASVQMSGLFRCKKCKPSKGQEKVFTSFFERNFHDSIAHGDNGGSVLDVACKVTGCDRRYDVWAYAPHVESRHNLTVTVPCPVNCCGNIEIQSLEQLWSHVVRSAGAVKYVCPICLHDRFFFNSHQLAKHLLDQHNVEKVNICVLCSAKKEPKIPSSRMRAAVYTAKCLICAKQNKTGLTPKYLLENAMAHLQEFHSHSGYLCLNCLTIRSVNDKEHIEKCLHATNEGLVKGGKRGYSEQFLYDAVIESFTAEEYDKSISNSEAEYYAKDKDSNLGMNAVTGIEDVEDQMEWRKTQANSASKDASSHLATSGTKEDHTSQ